MEKKHVKNGPQMITGGREFSIDFFFRKKKTPLSELRANIDAKKNNEQINKRNEK